MTYCAESVLIAIMSRLQHARKLGQILLKFIDQKGWTTRELGRRAGVDTTSIQNYVDGITLPNAENRERLAAIMSKSRDELELEIGLIAEVRSNRSIQAMCRDARLLNAEDFAMLAQVVFERAATDLRSIAELSEPTKD